MAEISISTDREKGLTTITIKGVLREDDLPNTLLEYFANGPTLNTIYDSTEGDWSNISTEYYRGMIRSGKAHARKGAKVAMVFSNSVNFGIGRMLESYSDFEGYENEHACFRTIEEAKNWLSQPG